MNDELPPHGADRMPTLTEVVELDEPLPGSTEAAGDVHSEPALPAASAGFDAQALVNEVLAELQPRIDMLFESRLREALAPALARAAEGLIREARGELGSALHELVDDAVKRALQRRGVR